MQTLSGESGRLLGDRPDAGPGAGARSILQPARRKPWLRRMASSFLDRLAIHIAYRIQDHESCRLIAALADSAEYAAQHMRGAMASPEKDAVLLEGLKLAPAEGLVAEFGVWRGRTINLIADTLGPERQVHGFDSFEGLPEDWFGEYPRGGFHMHGELPRVRPNVVLHKGWFDQTIPQFAREHPGVPVAFLHIDSDLYSSAKTVFDALADRLVPGSVIVFDEYFNYPGWREHEHRAFQEVVAARSLRYRHVAYCTHELGNVAIQITA